MRNISTSPLDPRVQVAKANDRRGVMIAIVGRWLRSARLSLGASDVPARVTEISNLNQHLRSDVGLDEGHCQGDLPWHDPLAVEMRGLR